MVKNNKNKIVYEKNINEISAKALNVIFPSFPDDMQELKNLVKLSNNEDIVPRANGTSFTGACIPNNSVIVDFSKMNKIIEINQFKKIAVVEPGVIVSELNEQLEPYGLEFPIIPLFAGIETIGGMIAKNSSGNREIKYGRMINWLDSLEIINRKGEQVRIPKSDLSDFAGMEGTTGLIIRANLRLTNKKQRSLKLLKANTLQDIFTANRKLRLKQDISSIDLVNPYISSLLGLENKYHIFIELESKEGSFKAENYEKFIKLKNKAYKKAATEGFVYMSNIKFLIDSLQDFLIYLEERKIPYFSHLASGVVYPLFRPEQIQEMQEAMKTARRLRGKIAYNFGIGLTKKDALEPGEKDLIKRVKNRHDPQYKFNRDKLIDAPVSIKEKIEKPIEENQGEKEVEKPEDKIEAKEKELEKAENKEEKTEAKTEENQEPIAQLSEEEREKVKKIAAGFFAGGQENGSGTG